MSILERWFGRGPTVVVVVFLAALLVAALSPAAIKKRVRAAIVLSFLAVVALAIAWLLPRTSPLTPNVELVGEVLAAIAGARLFFVLAVDVVWERGGRRPLNQLLRDVMQSVVLVVAAVAALRAGGINPTSLLATGTVVTAIVGLALQETLGNLAAGVAIQIDKPIALGEWVRLDKGDIVGRVVSTNWRSVTIQGDDRLQIVVPNGHFSRTPFTNFSRPGGSFRRSLYVTIGIEVPPSRVHDAILAACADIPEILRDPAPNVLTWGFTDLGVQYWCRFFVADFALRDRVQGELMTRIWFHLRRRKIEIALPVRRTLVQELDEEARVLRDEATLRDRRAALDAVDFLRPLTDDAKDLLASRGHRALYAAGETILREGEQGREFYVVRRGEVAVRVGDRELARLGPGQFFGELALLTGRARHATIVATTETEVFVIDEVMFEAVLQDTPEVAGEISRIVATRQAELEARATGVPPAPDQGKGASAEILDRIRHLFGLSD
jgi:small-conductance mechanosensitive channel